MPQQSELSLEDQRRERRNRATQLFENFARFHRENPTIWTLFERFALSVIHSSHSEHYSSKAIFERIRWHLNVETRGEAVKLNNNYTAFYGRLFHVRHPEHAGYFRTRKRISEDVNAYDVNLAVIEQEEAHDEETLLQKLRELDDCPF